MVVVQNIFISKAALLFYLYFFIEVCSTQPQDGDGCFEPGHGSNSKVTLSDHMLPTQKYPLMTRASYTCNTGYEMIGHFERTCLEGGIWSEKMPLCGVDVTTNTYMKTFSNNAVEITDTVGDPYYKTCSMADITTPVTFRVTLYESHNISVVKLVAQYKNPELKNVLVNVSVLPFLSSSSSSLETENETQFHEDYERFYVSVASNKSYAVFDIISSKPTKAKVIIVTVEVGSCRNQSNCLTEFNLCDLSAYSETALPFTTCLSHTSDNTYYGLYDHKCYRVRYNSREHSSWSSANSTCPYDWNLLQHITLEESVYLSHYLSWIINDGEGTRLWIGGQKRNSYSLWKWLDGTDIITIVNEPKNGHHQKKLCLQFLSNKTYFASDYCKDGLAKYWICSKFVSDCGIPDQRPGTMMSYSGTSVGSVGNYSCPTGYVLTSGDHVRTCLETGRWSGQAPICRFVDCGHPQVDDGQAFLVLNRSTHGSFLQTICDPGFVSLDGLALSRCDEDGTWRGSARKCSRINTDCDWMSEEQMEAQIMKDVIVNMITATVLIEFFVLICIFIVFSVLKRRCHMVENEN